MRITRIETLRLEEFANLLWVVVTTEDGLSGLGETFFGPRAVEAHIHDSLAPKLLGEDARRIDSINRRCREQYLGFLGTGAEMRAASAIDIALYDLAGKRHGVPVHELLGGLARERIRTYNTCAGYRYIRTAKAQQSDNWGLPAGAAEGPYEDLDAFLNHADELARSLMDEGIRAMKIWPFDLAAEENEGLFITPAQLEKGLEPFARIRDAVGDAMEIMVEFHSLWNLPTAIRIAEALEPYRPFWFEDPIRMVNMEALSEFAGATSVPVTASETVATRFGFREMLENGAVGIVMPDLSWCGGLTEARKIASLAETWQRPVAPHDCTGPVVFAASCHFSLAASNALIQESVRAFYSGWYRELVTTLPRIEQGWIYPMAGPGLGTALRPEVLERRDLHRTVSDADA